jgi:membrane protein
LRAALWARPHRARLYLRAFWQRAYRENVTGLAGMVAFNLVLSVFPVALLMLFVFGQVLKSPEVEASVLRDLQQLLPEVEPATLADAVERVRDNATRLGVIAAIAGIWIGASFWGAMDTAFCRIYHVKCRGWLEQKRFALGMLVVVALFLVASVVFPTLERLVISTTEELPLGLSEIDAVDNLVLLGATAALTFLILCLIYWAVPKGHLPWRGVWPGALFVTVTTTIANWLFPYYLFNVSAVGQLGGTVGFLLVALIWFYVLSIAILAGAVINALRYELHDTGSVGEPCWEGP